MKILLHDFGNYAFTRQLAETLAGRGHEVTYAYNATNPGPNQFNAEGVCGSGSLTNVPLDSGVALAEKKPFVQRLKMELAYSRVLLKNLDVKSFDTVISANTPSIIQSRLSKCAANHRIPFVSWVQDLYGYASLKILRKKIPILGTVIGYYFIHLDKIAIRRSQSIIVITDQFVPFIQKLGADLEKIHVIENWAPIARIPVMEKENDWSRKIGLSNSFRFTYTGTLAMKHDPSLLVELAKAFREPYTDEQGNFIPSAEVLLVSSGQGATYVQEQAKVLGLNNLKCIGFQPEHDFASILGSSDALIAILEQEAGQFSVPSKVLSYFCAARPILASIPDTNLAAQTINRIKAGHTASPGNLIGFLAAAKLILADAAQRSVHGANGRRYAEKAFDIQEITSRFEAILSN